jgi:hypothetical protein
MLRIRVLCLTQENAVDLHSASGGLKLSNKGQSTFLRANHCQGQLQTPQSVTVDTPPLVCVSLLAGVQLKHSSFTYMCENEVEAL